MTEKTFTQEQFDAALAKRLATMKTQRDEARTERETLKAQRDEFAASVAAMEKQAATYEAALGNLNTLQESLTEQTARWDAAQAVTGMGLSLGDTASLRALYAASPAPEKGERPAFGDWLKAEAAVEGSFVARVVGTPAAVPVAPAAPDVPAVPVVPAAPAAPAVVVPDAARGAVNGVPSGKVGALATLAPHEIIDLYSRDPNAVLREIGMPTREA